MDLVIAADEDDETTPDVVVLTGDVPLTVSWQDRSNEFGLLM